MKYSVKWIIRRKVFFKVSMQNKKIKNKKSSYTKIENYDLM